MIQIIYVVVNIDIVVKLKITVIDCQSAFGKCN